MRLYNTLTGEEKEFVPADGKTVKMYVCGVTPYSSTHVGHALSYVVFDTLRRYLQHLGYQVKHIQNFTDVDDKIIQRAQEAGVSENELTERYIDDFFRTMDALNIQRADIYPRATQEIEPILDTIQNLVDKDFAYAAGGDVYFRVNRKADYGKLSRRTLEGMIAGARVQVDADKEHPMDFVLWKGAKSGEPAWDSPWGPGRPGWHIECTAMSLRYLDYPLDIHGGGQDLIFPHHENEIAQSEAHTGIAPFAHHWVHNGLLQLGEDKMSKSLGNLVSVEEALQRISADALRVYFLSSHYRSPLQYSDEGSAAMERSMDRFRHALRPSAEDGDRNGSDAAGPASEEEALDAESHRQRFMAAMDDDLNTPQAIAALFDLAREINRERDAGRPVAGDQAVLRQLGGILGLTFAEPTAGRDNLAARPFIELLVNTRAELRQARQFALADRIRDELAAQGVLLEDTAQGTLWRYQMSG